MIKKSWLRLVPRRIAICSARSPEACSSFSRARSSSDQTRFVKRRAACAVNGARAHADGSASKPRVMSRHRATWVQRLE